MMKRVRNRLVSQIVSWWSVTIVLAVVLMPMTAHAQQAAPEPGLRSSPHPIIGFGIMFVMVIVVVSISLLPSKRGHQD